MKKIRKGDVVIIHTAWTPNIGFPLYGCLGEVESFVWNDEWRVRVAQYKKDVCFSGVCHLYGKDLEVIDHIDETPEPKPEVIQLSGQGPCVTANHPILCRDGSFKKAENITSDEIATVGIESWHSMVHLGDGMTGTVTLDGTKVVVTCTNCKHVIKTVDLKEGV